MNKERDTQEKGLGNHEKDRGHHWSRAQHLLGGDWTSPCGLNPTVQDSVFILLRFLCSCIFSG